ncbi:5-formyltetrahydrofolate cyclo-ligase [Runella sp.]|jgi:5-formyltetrahydrofolate cyclo-ligase|uniref:5-formyltetrahydrofolate cyclo-ligase n=1 Tax=Runella sp. TaxID=1960881 RepID=UPI00301630A1
MTKQELRNHFIQRRKALTTTEVAAQSQAIARLFFSFFSVENLKAIHTYLPIRRQNEVDTFPIIYTLQEKFLKTHVVISRSLTDTFEMEHYQWIPDMTLTINSWGILEPNPVHSLQYAVQNIDLVIVPLLAFDKYGNRVGYGKGFYDRFLSKCRSNVIKVGVSFFEPADRITDINPLDIRLDYCITPTRVWKMLPS